jgi:hypothetical protein
VAAALAVTPRGLAGAGTRADEGPAPDDGVLDDALRLLQDREPESRQGLSTHAPMVAEALCALGRSDQVLIWVERYRGPLLELPRPRQRIVPQDWRAALGARPGAATWEEALGRWADWRELFVEEMKEAPWPQVLDRWTARLAPGLCAAATHGVIRTAHAARGLARRETPERRAELARGLAYWAASYQELPARPTTGPRAATYAEALDRVPLFWERKGRVPAGNIVSGLGQAGELPGFEESLDRVAPRADVSEALSALTATSSRAYLRHGTQGRSVATIAFVHAVTGPCALRRLAPHVTPETARAALPYAWQAVAGIYAAYARRENPVPEAEPKTAPGELRARAVANGDEHAIKFTEALLAEHALRPDPAYLAAAEDAVSRL